MSALHELGWDDRWASLFAPLAEDGVVPARVAIEFNHIFKVMTEDGELQAQHSGRLLHRASARNELCAVGDWVAVRKTAGEQTGTIEEILTRRSKFSRKVAGDLTEEQVVAANIDTVFLVMGLDRDYNPRRLERYLLMSYESGASPVVLLSKADLVSDVAGPVAEISALAPGIPVHAITAVARALDDGSVVQPDVSMLEPYLGVGRTGALLGSSGAGKSTLINALAGNTTLKTAAVRPSDQRGRHTTRHRQLIVLPGRGLLIDTPGMRELQLWDITESTKDTFEDIEALGENCHFTNCQHRDEPRCAVKVAVDEGALTAERLASYVKLQEEGRALDARRDVRAQIDEKRRSKTIGKSLKQLYKDRGRE
ncbi:MAG TPA: ribosome small subunit-dependent GTPase A [Vicinamibacterales bacterium]|nr:ribosome small subunit-dependent GTPase A [Vicinamibacterales bacterium]